jgi:DNA-directed RNA polymerase subunit F
LPEAQQQLQYELETGNEYAQMIAKEELEKAKYVHNTLISLENLKAKKTKKILKKW